MNKPIKFASLYQMSIKNPSIWITHLMRTSNFWSYMEINMTVATQNTISIIS